MAQITYTNKVALNENLEIEDIYKVKASDMNEIKSVVNGIDNTVNNILLNVYPVGSIYMSINSTSPDTLFGGTWEQIKDTFLLSAGDTYNAGTTGGEATHKLTINEIPSHRHEGLTVTEQPANIGNGSSGIGFTYTGTSGGTEIKTAYIGGGQAHNNMPPYLTVYMWKRTA